MKMGKLSGWTAAAIAGAIVASGALATAACAADKYPSRPVTWIVPFGTGGQLDVMSRAMARAVEKHLGQPVVVKNAMGGGGTVGVTQIANATPDGYTVGLIPVTMLSVSPHRMKLSYDSDSFTYFKAWGNMPMGIAVPAKSSYQTMKDLVETARERRVTVVSTAPGGAQSLLLQMMNMKYKTQFREIPSKGGGEGVAAVLGGHTDAIISNTSILTGGNDLRLLASVSQQRWPNRPDVPTSAEQGFELPTSDVFITTAGPNGIPKEASEAWDKALAAAVKDPELIDVAQRFAMVLMDNMSGDEFKRIAKEQKAEFGPIIESLK